MRSMLVVLLVFACSGVSIAEPLSMVDWSWLKRDAKLKRSISRDPFLLPKAAPVMTKDLEKKGKTGGNVRVENLKLEAIIFGKKRATAIINGNILHEGDVIDGMRLNAVKGNSVYLSGRAGAVVLKLNVFTGSAKQ